MLRPEGEEGQNEEGEGSPGPWQCNVSFAFPLSFFRHIFFGGLGEKGKGEPRYNGVVARGLLRMTPDGDGI